MQCRHIEDFVEVSRAKRAGKPALAKSVKVQNEMGLRTSLGASLMGDTSPSIGAARSVPEREESNRRKTLLVYMTTVGSKLLENNLDCKLDPTVLPRMRFGGTVGVLYTTDTSQPGEVSSKHSFE